MHEATVPFAVSLPSRAAGPLFLLDSKLHNEKQTAQEMMKSLQKSVPPDQKPSIIDTEMSLEYLSACEDL